MFGRSIASLAAKLQEKLEEDLRGTDDRLAKLLSHRNNPSMLGGGGDKDWHVESTSLPLPNSPAKGDTLKSQQKSLPPIHNAQSSESLDGFVILYNASQNSQLGQEYHKLEILMDEDNLVVEMK